MGIVKPVFLYRNLISQTRHDERHAYALFIKRELLEHLVASARFTVVSTENDERLMVQRGLTQQREDSTNLGINLFDEPVIVPSQVTPMEFIPLPHPFKDSGVDKCVINPSTDAVQHRLPRIVVEVFRERW